MLLTIEDILSTDELRTARSLLQPSRWVSGQVSAGLQAANVKNNQQLPENARSLPELRHLVLNALNRSPLFFAATLPLKILPPFFNRYCGETNDYGFHIDNAMRLLPGQDGVYMRSDISATLFLSDPQSYTGGVLSIVDTFGTHHIKLQAGSLVIYPSSSVHAVTPVTQGERVSCFMFIQSMVRDPQQRRLLYDMDMALLKLRSEVGEIEPVVQLTGTYHNLLRRWAES